MTAPQIPNTGRILDVWLGGTHHFPIDQQAAGAFDQIYDRFPDVFSTLRGFIQRSAQYIERQGVDRFLVIGAGIPTQGNVHEAVPNAKVLYSDIDEENVRFGKSIVQDNSHCDYIFCDATELSVLDDARVTSFLGEWADKPIGIIVIGVAVFLNDQQLAQVLKSLYSRCAAGSYLSFDFDSLQLTQYPAALAMLGDGFFPRAPEGFLPLLGEWKLTNEGILPVQEWQMSKTVTEIPVFMYGGVARK
jgi:hypothetical protein